MKTSVTMTRKMGSFDVSQRTSDGYFDANELLSQWNSIDGNTRRKMSNFLQIEGLMDFIDALKEEISHSPKMDHADYQVVKTVKSHGSKMTYADFQAVKTVKGRTTKNGRTKDQVWMHPYLFIKFAMWINPRFEVKVIKFVYDEMIRYRNEAGDAYRELGSSVQKIVSRDFMPKAMQKVSEALNWVIFNGHTHGMRNKFGEEDKQRELYELEHKVSDLINEGFIKSYDGLINYLRTQYAKYNSPSVFSRTAISI